MAQSNEKVVRAIEAAWDSGRVADLDQYFAPNYRNNGAVPGLPPTLEGAKMAHSMVGPAFPDRKVEILDLVAAGDRVAVRTRVTGTNKGGVPWVGAVANDAPVDFESWSIYRLEDGRVAETWGINDAFLLGIQTGGITPPAMP